MKTSKSKEQIKYQDQEIFREKKRELAHLLSDKILYYVKGGKPNKEQVFTPQEEVQILNNIVKYAFSPVTREYKRPDKLSQQMDSILFGNENEE